ncbi:biotin--[acetyl-CoA-carboxylase] ligase [Demequina muriae]|uniref:biotin--[biotin carboxyl-carrier protein] ligase n=1 Tax=Demequina muriae TaxID=3051664 RepID=A0ABT8GF95_9MICO|nr:biotin--[acetyl-CoA-carboxylase] ligase [Demequina sp. EGI L300058]MDN4479944.1 biotin--[acetyl-CoA-carboxylase] ligase [Demequina sp. EGI L300058]
MILPSPAAVAASREPLTATQLAGIVGPTRQLSRLDVVASSPSTNTALLKAVAESPEHWPHLSGIVADHQTAGRGRAGREWATPRGAALTVSLVLRPQAIAPDALGWAPLVAGLATVRALRDCGVGAYLKWPNDVVVEAGAKDIPGWGRWRKVVGILCEGVPGERAVVAGIGINVSQSPAELPVPHAASLATLGATELDRVRLMRALAAHLRDAAAAWEGEADGDSVRAEVERVCATIGWDVAVDVPDGVPISGTAVGLSAGGALLVDTGAEVREVLAGDVRVRRA